MSDLATSHFALAYGSQLREESLAQLAYEGELPQWLSGSFISNGPAQFEVADKQFNHWFDGFAMLKKFTFNAGTVNFQNAFLKSKQYLKSNANAKLYFNEFDTYADDLPWMRLAHSLRTLIKQEIYDNDNVNTSRIANQLIAMTETSNQHGFSAQNLQTYGTVNYTDTLPGQMSLAHPQFDFHSQEIINITTQIAKKVQYHIYKMPANNLNQELIATYHSDELFYMHSFSITPKFIILFKSPLTCHKFKLLLDLPFNKTLSWNEKASSYFIVINRQDASVTEIEAEAFVCLHSVNAFELGNELILDLVCHEGGNPYNMLTLANLRAKLPKFHPINLRRYTLNLSSRKAQHTVLCNQTVEFPRINYSLVNGKHYQFAYMALRTGEDQPFFNAIQKIDVHTGKTSCWRKTGYYPGEPIFVPKSSAGKEDEGVLLFIALNTASKCSALIVLEAQNMQQLAEIALPFHLPFGLHGNFYA